MDIVKPSCKLPFVVVNLCVCVYNLLPGDTRTVVVTHKWFFGLASSSK